MDDFRALLAIVIFFFSSYLVYDLIANGFSWSVLVACIIGFWIVHFIWPKNQSQESSWYDFLEIVIDLPYQAVAFSLRSVSRLVRGSDGDIGIDL